MVQPEGPGSSSINTRRRIAMEMSVGQASATYPGIRFTPTDEELIECYLTKKLQNSGDVDIIPEIDICKHEPWNLPEESVIPSDREWYFFTTRDKKYPTGSQNKRATAMGYWKATGKERSVKLNGNIIGTKRTLVFHRGRAPRGQRTEWIMHEFCTIEENEKGIVVCRLRKNEEFHLDDNTETDSRDENVNTTLLFGSEQSQMEGMQSSGGEQPQVEGIQLSDGDDNNGTDSPDESAININTTLLSGGDGEQSQMEGIQLCGGEQPQMEGIQLSHGEQSHTQSQMEGIQLFPDEQSLEGNQLEISSLIECDSSYNSHSIEQPVSEELPASEESDEKIAPPEGCDERIAPLDDTASEDSGERNAAQLGSEEPDERIAEFCHGSSSLTQPSIEEEEDDCYNDIMKDDIINLGDENFGDTLESEIKDTTSYKGMPSQGTAHRRIRLRKPKSFRRKPSKFQNEVIAPSYERSFIAKLIHPSIFIFSLILVVWVVVWVVGWNGFQVLGYYP